MRLSRLQAFGSLVLAAILSAPAYATTQPANSALPGTVNYVEGQVSAGSQALDAKSIGSITLQTGESLTTQNGKVEMLLTPGVFLRLDDNSSAKMLSPSLTYTEVGLNRGRALVEVAEIHPQNDLRIQEDGATTQLLKSGIYDFDADHDQVRVYDGKAVVQDGDREVTVKGGHEVTLNAPGKLRAAKFDKNAFAGDDLYRWSSLRSSYLAEANVDAARTYLVDGWYGPGWFGAGWYWDPWFGAYTFIPGDGIFYSPFGWGFYSPFFAYRAPIFWGGRYYHAFGPGYRPGFVAHGYVGGMSSHAFHGTMARPAAPARGFGAVGGGFHGGFAGGGFHGGGFHGGFGGRR